MNIALWIVASVLAVVFALAGLMKLVTPRAQLQEKGQGWVEDFSDGTVSSSVPSKSSLRSGSSSRERSTPL